MPEYKWKPIQPISENLLNYSDEELSQLFSRWKELRKGFDPEAEKEFMERLKREWAIETGQIENLYRLSRGITETLIEKGISPSYIKHSDSNPSPEEIADLIKDQHEVVDGLFDFVGDRSRKLSKSYILEMHQVFTKHQKTTKAFNPELGQMVEIKLDKGSWKKWPNSPKQQEDGTLHEYAPPEQVESEMDRLISLHQQYEDQNIAPEVHAAWLHHAFTQIHPFQDGNGRVARALASIIFLKAGMLPLLVKDEQRGEYIDALEAADFGNLLKLVELFSENQKNYLFEAIEFGQDVNFSDHRIEESIVAYADRRKLIDDKQKQANILLSAFAKVVKQKTDELIVMYNDSIPKLIYSNIPRFSSKSNDHPSITIKPDEQLTYFQLDKQFCYWVQLNTADIEKIVIHGYCLSRDNVPAIIRVQFKSEIEDKIKDFSLTEYDGINRIDFRGWLRKILINSFKDTVDRVTGK